MMLTGKGVRPYAVQRTESVESSLASRVGAQTPGLPRFNQKVAYGS